MSESQGEWTEVRDFWLREGIAQERARIRREVLAVTAEMHASESYLANRPSILSLWADRLEEEARDDPS